jgi:hypothetical protein
MSERGNAKKFRDVLVGRLFRTPIMIETKLALHLPRSDTLLKTPLDGLERVLETIISFAGSPGPAAIYH